MCDSLCGPLRHRHRTSGVLLKASNRSARQPCNCRLPRVSSPCDLDIGPCRHRYRYDHPQRRSRVDDQERRPLQERVCDMLEGARHSLRCSSCHQPLRRLTRPPFRCLAARGPSAPKRSLHHSTGPLWFSASSCSCFPNSSCTLESCTSTPTKLRKETPCP